MPHELRERCDTVAIGNDDDFVIDLQAQTGIRQNESVIAVYTNHARMSRQIQVVNRAQLGLVDRLLKSKKDEACLVILKRGTKRRRILKPQSKGGIGF